MPATIPSLPILPLVGAACLLTPSVAAAQPARGARSELDGFASALDAAVRRVSRPSPTMLAGRETARAYRLPGYGAFFVLAPRSLPVPPPRGAGELSAARAVDEAIRHLEQGLRTAASPELREQMERNLQALRQTRAELQTPFRERAATVMVLSSPPTMALRETPDAGELRLEQLRRALESQMAEQIRALQAAQQSGGEPEREIARRMEAQVLELQARMEAVRREVEQARMDAEHQVEMRLAFPAPPEAPEPAPGAGPPGPAPVAAGDVAVPAPPLLPPAPWQYWFSMEESTDGRTEEAIVRDVKEAVTALLEKRGPSLRQIASEEYLTVAVDFVPRMSILGSRVQKTLVVRARKQDLDERRLGRLAPDELRRRIEYTEY